MARYTASADDVASGTASKTILQITNPATNPASHRIAIYGYRVSYRGTASTAQPVRTLIARQSTAGAGGVNVPVAKLDPSSPDSAMTAVKGPAAAWATEPTLGDIWSAQRLHPQSGMGEFIPLGDEVIVAPGGWLAVVVVAAATVDVTAQLYWREGH
ncbi:hypothetical protein GCM10027187_40760 [Streptosporangium sandarakinum]|uniref:Uncharacterized protein n=1 Tax=Streptosporangium sandarakinum TaxID=1260955 RepID=A0A852VBI3_9ACTN|nr:hypothetical protein [Streptosporangium sandarakinum]NYF44593.1 hypothetical protein [Streptosporangium sandarakinum]